MGEIGGDRSSRRIMVIDDDQAVRSSLSLLLKQAGFVALGADNPEEALTMTRQDPPDLLLLDLNFSVGTSGEEGLQLLSELKSLSPTIPVILITAWGSIPLAVEGMKRGAADFISKPWNNGHLLESIKTAFALTGNGARLSEPAGSRKDLNDRYSFGNIIGEDESLLAVLRTAGRVAATDASVLIMGESGTGKELLAEAIHANSPRHNGPFVKVNLGGISATLFESEMFGHKRGAFTDAVHDRVGRFEMAAGGTIFLDEIGDLDPASQVKLLRVLQDRSFEVLGTSRTTTVDFRLISATNRDLDRMVATRSFREDLYYRVNLITLRIPPLRQRPADIPLLLHYFIENLKSIYGRSELSVSSQAVNWLKSLAWPGNVRELKNTVERTVLLSSKDRLDIEDFQAQLQPTGTPTGTDVLPAVGSLTLEEMEASMIRKAFEAHGSNISRVARSLGLSRAALYRRLEKYGITV